MRTIRIAAHALVLSACLAGPLGGAFAAEDALSPTPS
jgi:hypothetical protein